jgi:hypothetical protein
MSGPATHIAITGLPMVLTQLVTRALEDLPDVLIVDQIDKPGDVLATRSERPRLLILGADQAHTPPDICYQLLAQDPTLRILVLGTQDNMGMGYWLGVRRCRISTLTVTLLQSGVLRLASMPLPI